MYGTDHTVERPTRTVRRGGETHTIRVRRTGRNADRRRAIVEQLAGVR